MGMNQKEATFQAIVNVTGHDENGECGPLVITKEQRAQVNMILFEGIRNGSIEMDTEKTDADLKQYVSGLISNWIRKDVRLNGGVKYAAKSPGSRAGSTDPQLKALRVLISKPGLTDTEKAEIQVYIDTRLSELSASKMKATVDFSALPTELAAKFNK